MTPKLNRTIWVVTNLWGEFSADVLLHDEIDLRFKRNVERRLLEANVPCEPVVRVVVKVAIDRGLLR